MDCFEGIIDTGGGCQSATGRISLKDIGIDDDFIGRIKSSAWPDVAALIASKRRVAVEYVARDVLNHYSTAMVARTFIDNDRLGKYADPEKLEAGDALYRYGIVAEVCAPGSNVKLNISRIEFHGETSGNVVVKVHDLYDGSEVGSATIDAVAGMVSGEEVAISIQARRRKLKLFISTEEDAFYRATMTGGCATCTGTTYTRGMVTAKASRVLKTDAVKSQNLAASQSTGGLSAIVSVSCDHGAWVCDNKEALALPLIYCLGREIMTEALYSWGRWGIQDVRREDVEQRRDELEAHYSKAMQDVFGWMRVPNDPACFVCNSRVTSGVILP